MKIDSKLIMKELIQKIDFISINFKIIYTSPSSLVLKNKQDSNVTTNSTNKKDNSFLKDLPSLMFYNVNEDHMMTEQIFIISYYHKEHCLRKPSHSDKNLIVNNTALRKNNCHPKEQNFIELENYENSMRFSKKEYMKSIDDSS